MANNRKKPIGATGSPQAAARLFTPLQVYNAFPDIDSMCVVPPEEGEDRDTYFARIRGVAGVDTLFKFVVDHLCGHYHDNLDDCESDLDSAIDDLMTVKAALFASQSRGL